MMGAWTDPHPLRKPGRPKSTAPAKDGSRESYNRYMKEYMRKRRRQQGIPEKGQQYDLVARDQATYDPQRDGPAIHDSLTAVLMGDPPIGRRAIDR